MVLPSTTTGLLVVLFLVLPGSIFTWAYERQTSAYGVNLADRLFRFVAVSLIFHLALAWPEYALFRTALVDHQRLDAGQFAALWSALLVLLLVPLTVGRRWAGFTPRARIGSGGAG